MVKQVESVALSRCPTQVTVGVPPVLWEAHPAWGGACSIQPRPQSRLGLGSTDLFAREEPSSRLLGGSPAQPWGYLGFWELDTD